MRNILQTPYALDGPRGCNIFMYPVEDTTTSYSEVTSAVFLRNLLDRFKCMSTGSNIITTIHSCKATVDFFLVCCAVMN